MDLSTDDIAKLRDLVGTAVVSLGAAGTWLTFWHGRVDKREERQGVDVRELDGLEKEIEGLRPWAEPGYDDASHDDNWLVPTSGVYDVVSNYIDTFASSPAAHFFGKKLVAAVLDLQAAIRRFRSLLMRHREFVTVADPALKARALAAVHPFLRVNGGGGLKLEDVATLPVLSDADRAWLRDLYRLSKEVHTLGIGKAGEPGKLFDERVKTAAAVVDARKRGGRRLIEEALGVVGHLFATAFAFVGGYLLYLAIATYISMVGRPASAQQPARPPELHAAPSPAVLVPATPAPTQQPSRRAGPDTVGRKDRTSKR